MWNWLYPSNATLQPIRLALQSASVSGHGNLFAFTGNYRFELRGRTFGTYFIGGPGWYYRTASLSRPVPEGTTITCSPAWQWWGYNCAAGLVITNLTEVHSNVGALGYNAGIGFTFRAGEALPRADAIESSAITRSTLEISSPRSPQKRMVFWL